MATGVIQSVPGPALCEPELLDALMTLVRRAEYLGLLKPDAGHRPNEAAVWLPAVVAAMTERGLPTGNRWRQLERTAGWKDLTGGNGHAAGVLERVGPALSGAVRQINDQLEMSPQPAVEWAPVLDTLGEDLLAELVGVSISSVRRYAGGTRATPQDIAERLHFLALLIADLAGSYNDFGIRRWFKRPRAPLSGRTPASLLGQFDPEGPDAAAVARLAAALVGVGAG